MKNTKKFAAMLAALTLTACSVAPMFSFAKDLTGSITISAADGETHAELKAYQIFTGTEVAGEEGINITDWGSGVNVSELITAVLADDTIKDKFDGSVDYASDASAFADVVSTWSDNSEEILALDSLICKNLGTAAGTDSGCVISGLATGYYVVVDSEAATKYGFTSYTKGLIEVVKSANVAVTAKIDFPTFDKKIGDINDSSATTFTFNEAADHDINDKVPFQLIAKVPSNIDKYDTYKMIFHDNIEASVWEIDDSSFKVYLSSDDEVSATEDTDITASWTKAEGGSAWAADDPHVDTTEDFTYVCNDIKKIADVSGGKYIIVQYKATLTDQAKLGATGNWNGAYLEYSNNPNISGSGGDHSTGTSPKDYVVAFTYQTLINKTDEKGDKLAGATFQLYKKLTGTKTDNYGDACTETGYTNYYAVGQSITVTNGYQFEFRGLDDGQYVLVETKAPTSYKKAAPIEFTITAEETQTDVSEALSSLTGSKTAGGEGDLETGKVYTISDSNSPDAEYVADGAEKGSLTDSVKNTKLTSLPSTGGMGTTLFYLGGGCMVAVAGVVLITKKRMGKSEE